MPLHPAAARLIADARASGRPNAHLLPVEEARKNFENDFAALPRPDVAVIQDLKIPIADGARTIPARLYRASASADAVPVVVYFHGGGWLLGSVDSHDGITRRLALATGMAVLSVGYRRGPEDRFPAAIADAVAAVLWTTAHASEIGADPAHLAVAGDSAGGNLATVAASLLRDNTDVTVRHQLLIYPSTTCDLEVGFDPRYEGIMLYRDELQWHQDNYLSEATQSTDPRVSPLGAELRGMPSATVILAECDPIRPQGELYIAALQAAGVPVASRTYPGMLHGFFGLDMMWDEARDALAFAAEHLIAALRASGE